MENLNILKELRKFLLERTSILQEQTEKLIKEIKIISLDWLKEQILENSENTLGILKMIKNHKLEESDAFDLIFSLTYILRDDLKKYKIYKETRKKVIFQDRYNKEKIWEITKLDQTNYKLCQFVMGRKTGEEIENKSWIEKVLDIKLA